MKSRILEYFTKRYISKSTKVGLKRCFQNNCFENFGIIARKYFSQSTFMEEFQPCNLLGTDLMLFQFLAFVYNVEETSSISPRNSCYWNLVFPFV